MCILARKALRIQLQHRKARAAELVLDSESPSVVIPGTAQSTTNRANLYPQRISFLESPAMGALR
jgi:hypothetical protein